MLRPEAREGWFARLFRTTLVLKAYSADFSTEANNSALIAFDEIFAPRQRRNENKNKNENKKKRREIFPTIRFG